MDRLAEVAPAARRASSGNTTRVELDGDELLIPHQLLNDPLAADVFASLPHGVQVVATAIYSRHTSGFVREHCMRQLCGVDAPWVAPYLLLSAGDWVREVAEPLASHLAADSKASRQTLANLVSAARQNPVLFRRVRARATSYWTAYWRPPLARHEYPGVAACVAILEQMSPRVVLDPSLDQRLTAATTRPS